MSIESGLPSSEAASRAWENKDEFEAEYIKSLKIFADQVLAEAKAELEVKSQQAREEAARESWELFEKYRRAMQQGDQFRKNEEGQTADYVSRIGLDNLKNGLREIRKKLSKKIKG